MLIVEYLLAVLVTFAAIVGLIVRWTSGADQLRPSILDIWYHGLLAVALWMLILMSPGGALNQVIIMVVAAAAFALKGIEIARMRRDQATPRVSKKS